MRRLDDGAGSGGWVWRVCAATVARLTRCLIETPSAYPNLTAYGFLSVATRLKQLPGSEIGRGLEPVGLHVDRRQRIEHFSLGMKRRLTLAFALVGKPRLLVLDEPTNGLDPDGMQDIRHLLSTLPERAGCTIFFFSHLLDVVEKTATRMAVPGRTARCGCRHRSVNSRRRCRAC